MLQAKGKYQFTVEENNQDYSSGRVLYGATGASNFPVRLADELFQRALLHLKHKPKDGYTVYDPFCGAAYTLTVLGFLHGSIIKFILASDIDTNILKVAEKNLSLLTHNGLNKRLLELKDLSQKFGKESHAEAIKSANNLINKLKPNNLNSKSFQYDVLSGDKPPIDLKAVDLVITDLPYGKLNKWHGQETKANPVQKFLDNVGRFLNPNALLCITCDKSQQLSHAGFEKISSFKLGKRKTFFLKYLPQSI